MAITVHTDTTLYRVKNDTQSTLTADVTSSQTTLPVADGTKFLTTGGFATIVSTDSVDNGKVELVAYTGVSTNTLTSVSRGVDSTTAVNADSGDTIEDRVIAQHHNSLLDGLKTTSQDLADVMAGDEAFSEAAWSRLVGSTTHTADISHDASGDLNLRFDATSDFFLKFASTSVIRAEGDGSTFQLAGNQFRGYPSGQLGTSSKLGWQFEPNVASGSTACAFDFLAINDLTTTGALVARFKNAGTAVMSVGKSLTTVPSLECSGGIVRLPVFTSARSSPVNDDVWFENVGSVRTLKVRISGVTYSVTLT